MFSVIVFLNSIDLVRMQHSKINLTLTHIFHLASVYATLNTELFLMIRATVINDVHDNNILKENIHCWYRWEKFRFSWKVFFFNVQKKIFSISIILRSRWYTQCAHTRWHSTFDTQIARHLFLSFVIYLLFFTTQCVVHTRIHFHFNVRLSRAFSLEKFPTVPSASKQLQTNKYHVEKLCRNCECELCLDNE